MNLKPACIAKLFKFSCFGAGFAWFKFRALLCTKNVSQTFFVIPQWHFSIFFSGRQYSKTEIEGEYFKFFLPFSF
jgi:hypothetical protein